MSKIIRKRKVAKVGGMYVDIGKADQWQQSYKAAFDIYLFLF